MTRSLQFRLLSFLLCLASLRADTVVLSTGESVKGHLLSADEHTVRIQDACGIIEEIPRVRVTTIRFSAIMASEKAASASPPISPHEAPEEQRQFCSLVTQFQKEQMVYPQETNPIRKAGMLPPDPYRYEPQVRALFGPQPQFVKWTGRLRFATSGRSVGIVFTPTCDPPQMIQFANFVEQPGFPGQDRATVIHTDSPIARTLSHA